MIITKLYSYFYIVLILNFVFQEIDGTFGWYQHLAQTTILRFVPWNKTDIYQYCGKTSDCE